MRSRVAWQSGDNGTVRETNAHDRQLLVRLVATFSAGNVVLHEQKHRGRNVDIMNWESGLCYSSTVRKVRFILEPVYR